MNVMKSWMLINYQEKFQMEEFKVTIKKTKYIFFNKKIQEIVTKNKRPWDLIKLGQEA